VPLFYCAVVILVVTLLHFVAYARMHQIATHNFIKYVQTAFHHPAPAILGRFEKNGNTQCTEALIKKSAVVDSGARILEDLLAGQTSASREYIQQQNTLLTNATAQILQLTTTFVLTKNV